MAKFFISYRREDAGFAVDQIHKALKSYVRTPDDIFVDIDNIPPGVDFVDHLNRHVDQCDVMLVAIGLNWLRATNKATNSHRLDDPDDFVRIEIASALSRGISVVPLLLGGSKMPSEDQLPDILKPLIRRQAVEVPRGGVQQAIGQMMKGLGFKEIKKTGGTKRRLIFPFAALILLAVGGVGLWQYGVLDDLIGARLTQTANTKSSVERAANVLDEAPMSSELVSSVDNEGDELRNEIVMRLQEALAELEYYKGGVDGEVSSETRTAALRFAVQYNLDSPSLETGTLNELDEFVGIVERVVVTERISEEDAARERETQQQRQREMAAQAERERQQLLSGPWDELSEFEWDRYGEYLLEGAYEKFDFQSAKRAADAGNANAAAIVGLAYEYGNGVSGNETMAVKYYSQACEGGRLRGCYHLSKAYKYGTGVSENRSKARQILEKACDDGNGLSCASLDNE